MVESIAIFFIILVVGIIGSAAVYECIHTDIYHNRH